MSLQWLKRIVKTFTVDTKNGGINIYKFDSYFILKLLSLNSHK